MNRRKRREMRWLISWVDIGGVEKREKAKQLLGIYRQ
jgi:hypothetical protein